MSPQPQSSPATCPLKSLTTQADARIEAGLGKNQQAAVKSQWRRTFPLVVPDAYFPAGKSYVQRTAELHQSQIRRNLDFNDNLR